ncbi:WD40 repeat-like protein [Backusella circina FSU 941]|nr:WD40 repeat-like protein [Backusella circina FSU 941]
MDVQWIQEDQQSSSMEIALAFAHNFIEIYNIDTDTPILLHSVQCQVRCILYAARFFGHTRSTLTLASGTVFNEVHLWKLGDGQVERVLRGHEGVIFGVRFNNDGTRLTSVSDDRTIRIWSLNSREEPLVLYGHTARIWDCQFVDDEHLVSISEDATCRVWRLDECIACWEGHVGKNVFSCAVNGSIVATGGQDSGIRLWSLLSARNSKIDSEEELTSFPLEVGEDYVRNFVLVKDHVYVGATTQGYLLKCDTTVSPHEWTRIQFDPTYKNYAIMTSSECGRVVVIGNILGGLNIISPGDLFEPIRIAAHKQKLFEIFIEQGIDENILYIISNGYNDCVLFHRLDLSDPSLPTIRTLFDLEMPTERTTLLSVGLAEKENVLICGSRESALLVYRLPLTHGDASGIVTLKPSLQLRRTHGRQAITHILVQKSSQNGVFFWTTGRDGCYIQYRLHNMMAKDTGFHVAETQLGVASRGDTITASQDMILEKLYRNKVTKGTLERALLIDGELLLCGFLRNHFFVHNENKNFCVFSINCGGGHRRWQFNTRDAKLSRSSFSFIRKEVLYSYFRDTSTQVEGYRDSILQPNYHGRDVRAIHFMRFDDEAIAFATGGEDTVLRLQQYLPTSTYVTLANIRKHASVIKTISTSRGIASLLFTSGGLEELRCWKLEPIPPKVPGEPIGLNCLEWASCPTLSQDIETRIMDTAVYVADAQLGLHLVGVVYSDAMMRFWLFNEQTRKFSLVADGAWHGKCILQIAHSVVNGRVLFLTSATDGKIAVWDMGDELDKVVGHVDLEMEPTRAAFRLDEPTLHYTSHMSGVNALSVVAFKDECHMAVITGGDDNAVAVTLIEVKKEGIAQVGEPFIIPSAHASSVTGITVVKDTVFSISTDQRLIKWKLKNERDHGVSLNFDDMIFIDVPDPSTVDAILLNDTVHIAVSGVGLQIVKTSL